MKTYHGHNVTATRYHFAVIGNDYHQTYQIIDTRHGGVLYHNDDEDECLKRLILLSGVKDYDTRVMETTTWQT